MKDCRQNAFSHLTCRGFRSKSEVIKLPVGFKGITDSVAKQKDPWGRDVYWIGGGTITWSGDTDTDYAAVAAGYVAITPLHLDLTHHPSIATVSGWSLDLTSE